MRDPRRELFLPYLRDLADLMNLRDWSVGIGDDAPGSEAMADVNITFGRKSAMIRLSESFLADDLEEQRHVLVHELMHLHFDGACKGAQDAMDADLFSLWLYSFEHGIDAAAGAISQAMPLRKLPVKEKAVKPKKKLVDRKTRSR